jgi:LmbE family N-acetylglucosaminyl deacetylase
MVRAAHIATLFALIACAQAAVAQPYGMPLKNEVEIADVDRIENWTGKTIMIFTPHPDDDTFSMGGTMARLAEKGNKVIIVIYTNDNKGSKDLTMTRERLAQIRRAEEEEACKILGIPKENITWLGYEDGDLEYADPQRLRGEVCRLIKIHRPDAIFSPDPGDTWEQWHKTDHRMAAFMTKDSFIAAEWHLYYPQHLLDEGLKPFSVPLAFYYYSAEPNYEIDITSKFEAKIKASAAHVSQFEPSLSKYSPENPKAVYDGIYKNFAAKSLKTTGKGKSTAKNKVYVERFRREVAP